MDPLTITTSVLKITATCVSATKGLYELREHFKYANLTIVSICSESTVISASLSQLQYLVLRKNNLENVLEARPELAAALDTALIGCAALFSCLEKETKRMNMATALAGNTTRKSKAKAVWSKDQLKELLDSLRGHQIAINTITSLLQMDSLEEIRHLLHDHRDTFTKVAEKTRSLRELEPDVEVPRSIYGGDDNRSIYSTDPSVMAPSELEFDFDDQIVTSKVYRRILAKAMHEKSTGDVNVIEGDLIDFSDDLTIKDVTVGPEEVEDAAQLLEGLDILRINQEPTEEWVEVNKIVSGRPGSSNEVTDRAGASNLSSAAVYPVDANNSLDPSNGAGSQHGTAERRVHHSKAAKRPKAMRFGDHILGQTVGEGDQAKVKVAWKRDGGFVVAMKLIRRDILLGSKPAGFAKVYRQVAILRSLQHPNIVRLHEMIETERHIGISLEYASGGPLGDYIDRHGSLTDNAARRLFAQLISGLGYLHKKGIVHRNLKLDNVLLDRNRNIIIAGFRFATTFHPDDELTEENEENLGNVDYIRRKGLDIVHEDGHRRGDLMQTSCGSSPFAAPEVILMNTLYTGRKADVWSCGVILYAMLTSRLPWYDSSTDLTSIDVLYTRIVTRLPTFPEFINLHARDLLKRTLVPDARKRADLFEVARHSYLSGDAHAVNSVTK